MIDPETLIWLMLAALAAALFATTVVGGVLRVFWCLDQGKYIQGAILTVGIIWLFLMAEALKIIPKVVAFWEMVK